MLDADNLAALTVAELVAHVRELRQANAQLRRQLRPIGPPLAAQALTEELIRQTALLTRLGIEFREDIEPTALVQQVLQSITVHLPADEATIILVGPDQTHNMRSRSHWVRHACCRTSVLPNSWLTGVQVGPCAMEAVLSCSILPMKHSGFSYAKQEPQPALSNRVVEV